MSVSRATQSVLTFPLIDNSARPAYKSSAASIVTKVSKDGAAFATTTNSAAEIGSSGVYALTLTAAELAAAMVTLTVTATGCDNHIQMISTTGLADGVVTGSPSTTTIPASGQTESATDFWKGAFLRFTSGSLAGQVRQITGYTTGSFTVSAFTAAPAAGDRYVLVNA